MGEHYNLTCWVLDVRANKAYPVQQVTAYDDIAYFFGLPVSEYKSDLHEQQDEPLDQSHF